MNETKTQLSPTKLIATLDSLLDTRFGLMNKTGPDVASQVTVYPSYFQRTTETFHLPKIGEIGIKSLSTYKGEIEDILPYSVRTTLWAFVCERMVLLLNANTEMRKYSSISLEINTAPFRLTTDEADVLREVFIEITNGLFDVSVVYIDEKDLTPSIVAKNYTALFFYNPSSWINMHKDELMKGATRDVELYTPSNFQMRDLNDKERRQFREFGMGIHDATKMLFAPVINWIFLPVKLFCLECPVNRPDL